MERRVIVLLLICVTFSLWIGRSASRSRDVREVSTKPGTCPIPQGAGICVELCEDDSKCPGSQKCCSNGCGHVCVEPVDL